MRSDTPAIDVPPYFFIVFIVIGAVACVATSLPFLLL